MDTFQFCVDMMKRFDSFDVLSHGTVNRCSRSNAISAPRHDSIQISKYDETKMNQGTTC